MNLRVAVVACAVAVACGKSGSSGPPIGATEFRSRPSVVGGSGSGDINPTSGGSPSAAPADADAGVAREVAEGDLYAWSGTTLFVLNGWRGLSAVDLSDPARPRLLSRVPLTGRPVELYLRGTVAFLTVSDWWGWSLAADGSAAPETRSQLWTIDVSDPSAPRVLATVPIEGSLVTTRTIGSVLYAIARPAWGWYGGPPVGGGVVVAAGAAVVVSPPAQEVAVVAIDLADPSSPREVSRVAIPFQAWAEVHADVRSSRITLALSGWDASGPRTRVVSLDVSDPAGAIVRGGEVDAPGRILDRWCLDLDEGAGVLRAVLDDGWNRGATVRTWRAATAAATPEPLGALALDVLETLTAARFDGARAYVVTAVQRDPLWVVDVADPAKPVLVGHLEMPGRLDHLVPRGERLLALGHTDENGAPWQLHASLFDVAGATPTMRSRVFFGGDYGWLAAQRDDVHKAFQVLDDGLVAVPFQGWDRATWEARGGTQLLSLTADALAKEGFVPGTGAVLRAVPVPGRPGVLAAFSDEKLQVVDASARSAPAELASLDLARSAWDLARAGDHLVALAGTGYGAPAELVTTRTDDPDAVAPVGRAKLGGPASRVFVAGGAAWVLVRDWRDGSASLQAFDLADPAHPAPRGSVALRAPGGFGWVEVAVSGDRPLAAATVTEWSSGAASGRLLLVDLSDPSRPEVTWSGELAGWFAGAPRWIGARVYVGRWEWDGGYDWVRWWLERLDVADARAPARLAAVNVPGELVAASDDGRRLYTLETAWDRREEPRARVHRLDVEGGVARLAATVELDGWPSGAVARGDAAWVTTTRWLGDVARAHLASIDLGAMRAGDAVPLDGRWPYPLGAAGDRLLVASSWPVPGVLVFDVSAPLAPSLVRFQRTEGLGWRPAPASDGARAWLAAGPYGIATVPLGR